MSAIHFGTSPVLFTDSRGRALVAVTNKNGILYAFDRSNVSAGPVWEVLISGLPGSCFCDGSFSTGVFDGARLYFAAAGTTIGGQAVAGSVRAIDPNTGAFVWEHALPALVYGALAEANGMIAVPSSDGGLYIVRASDGTVVYGNGLTGAANGPAIYGAPTIANGSLFIGTTDGVVHAFSFPSSAPVSGASARTASAEGASCTAARSGGLTARCRLTISARKRCIRLGELPSVVGAVAVAGVAVQASGAGARSPSRVRLYLNGSCSGAARMVIRIAGGHGTLHFSRPPVLAPGTVASVSAPRPLQLWLRVRGHLATKRPQPALGSLPPPSPP